MTQGLLHVRAAPSCAQRMQSELLVYQGCTSTAVSCAAPDATLPPAPRQAFVLPSLPGVPPFKSFSVTHRNVLSLEVGKRQFYTGAAAQL